ncbi:MAG: DNA repair protein RadC [Gemmatimonadota bacterium]|nr:MAG: DNA repair protein RadC [Gemmatimonadota bacterium]
MDALGLSDTRTPDRPRERLFSLGSDSLTTAELLAILIGTGTWGHDALVVAQGLLRLGTGSLRELARRPPAELAIVPGVGRAKAARIAAALELARRLTCEVRAAPYTVRGPVDVHRWCAPTMRDLAVEEFRILALDAQNRITRDLLITRGILDSSLVHPREVFRAAIAEAAAGVIVVHNHPSGDPAPSADDRAVTRQLVEAGRVLDIPVHDHVVVGGEQYFSFAEAGLL